MQSPQQLGWYSKPEADAQSTVTEIGANLLVPADLTTATNPKAEGWYEKSNDKFFISSDTKIKSDKEYYAEPDMFVFPTEVTSELIFTIDENKEPHTYILEDIFKYNPNENLGNGFDEIREKVARLDVDDEYNYTFVPTANDLIENPLSAKSFFNSNHIYNEFIIPQLDFDEAGARFITTKVN